jgi:hypothetical protein
VLVDLPATNDASVVASEARVAEGVTPVQHEGAHGADIVIATVEGRKERADAIAAPTVRERLLAGALRTSGGRKALLVGRSSSGGAFHHHSVYSAGRESEK